MVHRPLRRPQRRRRSWAADHDYKSSRYYNNAAYGTDADAYGSEDRRWGHAGYVRDE